MNNSLLLSPNFLKLKYKEVRYIKWEFKFWKKFFMIQQSWFNIHLWLKFGLANVIAEYERLKIRIVCVGNF